MLCILFGREYKPTATLAHRILLYGIIPMRGAFLMERIMIYGLLAFANIVLAVFQISRKQYNLASLLIVTAVLMVTLAAK